MEVLKKVSNEVQLRNFTGLAARRNVWLKS